MPGSPNKLSIDTLLQTVQRKDPKLYDALLKMAADLNKTYSALFDGPLPAVDGEFLDLTLMPESSLPATVAFTDVSNIFIEDQQVQKTFPSYDTRWFDDTQQLPGTIVGRFTHTDDGSILVSGNLSFDGTDWNTDDGNDGAGLEFIGATIDFIQNILGINYYPFKVDVDQIIRLGNPTFWTDSDPDELVIMNDKEIRATDSTETKTLPIAVLSANDLVVLGSTPVGSTSGEGNISIPRCVNADLPVAGGTRNGIIIIDTTNHRICYYVNGNRYFMTTGTSF